MNLTAEEAANVRMMIRDITIICKTMLEGNSNSFSIDDMTNMLRNYRNHWETVHHNQVKWCLAEMGIDVRQDDIQIIEFLECGVSLTNQMMDLAKEQNKCQ